MKATQKYKNITNKANIKEIKQRRRHIITAKQAGPTYEKGKSIKMVIIIAGRARKH